MKSIITNKRLELNMTMKQLSELVGVSEATISRWESGNIANMKQNNIIQLANALNISPLCLLYDSNDIDNNMDNNKMYKDIKIGKALKDKRKENNLTLEQLAFNLNNIYPQEKYTKGKISKWERDVEIPRVTSLKKLVDYLGTTIDEILTMNNDDINNKIDNNKKILDNNYNKLNNNNKNKLVDYSTKLVKEEDQENNNIIDFNKIKESEEVYSIKTIEKVSAGRGYNYTNNDITTYYTDRADLKGFDFATVVYGDSMIPHYNNGDIVLVKQGYDNVNGDVYIVDYNNKTYIKKVYNDGDRIRLVSINKKYDNIIINIPNNDCYFNIIGKVVDSFTPIKNI